MRLSEHRTLKQEDVKTCIYPNKTKAVKAQNLTKYSVCECVWSLCVCVLREKERIRV